MLLQLNVIKIKNGIINYFNVEIRIILHAKKIIVGILADVFVKIASIQKVLFILQ